jgi:hypothetical protein
MTASDGTSRLGAALPPPKLILRIHARLQFAIAIGQLGANPEGTAVGVALRQNGKDLACEFFALGTPQNPLPAYRRR